MPLTCGYVLVMPNPFRFIRFSFFSLPRWKQIGIALAVFLIAFVGSSIFQFIKPPGGYVFEKATRSSVVEIVSDSGKIVSDGKVKIDSPTNGIIETIFVENGQRVNEKDNLFTVKSSATVQEQQTAYADYLTAVSTLKTAQSTQYALRSAMLTKWKTYFDLATNSTYESSKGVPNETNRVVAEFHIAQDDWFAAEQKYKTQETAIAAYQADVNAKLEAYKATQTSTVVAPVSGIVANLAASAGNSVTALTILTPDASPVLTLVSSPAVEAVLAVGQTNIAKVKVGQFVTLHPDSYKDRDYKGEIVRVDALGENIAGVIVYNVYVKLTDADEMLKSGMTVDGDIITNQRENVLTVPNSAVVLYDGGKAVRILERGNVIKYIPVTVGIKGETRTEILKGITEGQQIITALTNEKVQRQSLLGL